MPRWRGLQATTVAHRLVRTLSGTAGTTTANTTVAGTTTGGASPVRSVATTAGRAVVVPTATTGDDLAAVLRRAGAAGAAPAAVAALAEMWPTLDPRARRGVARPLGDGRPGPLRVAGVPARQTDRTTCGSAVLAMLAVAGDPALALWLVTGRLLPGYLPLELRGMPAAPVVSPDPAVRWAGLQRALQRASTRRALGPLPWPAALGTPPWGAARAARFGDVAWTHVLVDDGDPALVDRVLDRADAALAAGVPVPLFTGGDLGGGPAAAVPRHVVLLVPHVPDGPRDDRVVVVGGPGGGYGGGYAAYEPSSGRVVRLTRGELARPGGPHPALGGWSHVTWAVLPR